MGIGSLLAAAYVDNAVAYTFNRINVPFSGASDTSIFGINDLSGDQSTVPLVGTYLTN